jgi:hypothetical protein
VENAHEERDGRKKEQKTICGWSEIDAPSDVSRGFFFLAVPAPPAPPAPPASS